MPSASVRSGGKPRRQAAGGTPRPKVLIAPDYLEPLRSLLSDQDWDITVARTTAEVRFFAEGGTGVLVLGVDMPDGDSFELCEALRQEPDGATLPVILVTPQQDAEQQLRALAVGADEIITMPISRPQLVLRIRSQLRIWELRHQAKTHRSG